MLNFNLPCLDQKSDACSYSVAFIGNRIILLSDKLLKRCGDFLLAGFAIAGEEFFYHAWRNFMIGRLFR